MTAPMTRHLTGMLDALATDVDFERVLGAAPFAGEVTEVLWTPNANLTGANTNSRKIEIINKGQDGNGSTVVAVLDFTSGVNALDFDAKTIPLSVVADATDVLEGDQLAVKSTAPGSGIADPGGAIDVEISRT